MRTALKILAGAVLIVPVAIIAARVLFPLPAQDKRTDSIALPPSDSGRLAHAVAQRSVDHDGLTGIAPLQNGANAFAARIITADAAVTSIDAQYYI